MPTLDEVFRLIARQPRQDLVAYVELKTVRKRALNDWLVDAVVQVIRRHNLQSRVIVISFNLAALSKVKELDPSIHTGVLFGPRQRATKSARRIVAAALDCGASEILLHHLITKRQLLAIASEARLSPVVWTVEDAKWLKRAPSAGIRALMTNNPAKMLAR